MNLQQWLNDYYNRRKAVERLGQAFCNDFIKESWPRLYYSESESQSLWMINAWLGNHHYFNGELPVGVK